MSLQVAPVIHTNLDLRRISLKPFDGQAVEQQQSYAPTSIGPIYTKEGLIKDDVKPPVGYNPVNVYAR